MKLQDVFFHISFSSVVSETCKIHLSSFFAPEQHLIGKEGWTITKLLVLSIVKSVKKLVSVATLFSKVVDTLTKLGKIVFGSMNLSQ